jgi:hypothetical protein
LRPGLHDTQPRGLQGQVLFVGHLHEPVQNGVVELCPPVTVYFLASLECRVVSRQPLRLERRLGRGVVRPQRGAGRQGDQQAGQCETQDAITLPIHIASNVH